MRMELPEERFRALPVQVLEVDGGVVLKRARTEVKVQGEGAAEAVRCLLAAASGNGITRDEILELFAKPEQPVFVALFDHLSRRRLLVPAAQAPSGEQAESCTDVFYWQFAQDRSQVAGRLAQQRLLLLGVNRTSRQLAVSLAACGAGAVCVWDDPFLRNLELFDDSGELRPGVWPPELAPPILHQENGGAVDPGSVDCLVAVSDHGAVTHLRHWNEFCHLHRLMFLPVMLRDLIGYAGPLVVPDETACFECMLLRERTHLPDPAVRRVVEEASGASPGLAGFLPPMATTLGDIAALELVRFFGMGPSLWRVGSVVEVNLMGRDVTARKILRLPRCPVCTPLEDRTSLAVLRSGSLFVTEGGT